MAQPTVKTVQYIDPRIEPQPDPVYDYVIGPTQNQYYKIPASGKSNSSLTFNNLTTLGVDRAYLDTFEIELGVTITFNLGDNGVATNNPTTVGEDAIVPAPDEWTFQSFPFNTCCDEARVNINGGAFFSQPMSYVRAKERYMNQYELSKCYENVCPVHKPICQTETGRNYNQAYSDLESASLNLPVAITPDMNYYTDIDDFQAQAVPNNIGVPTRLGVGMYNFMQSSQGADGGYNNSIVRLGAVKDVDGHTVGWENMYREGNKLIVKVTWREPLFVSPFSSRYDATYGRPLYNITSMDFAFNLMNLGNMIRVANLYHSVPTYSRSETSGSSTTVAYYRGYYVKDYSINIDTANLCYQVMTIPSVIQKPLTTLVPYRRFVPYITEYTSTNTVTNQQLQPIIPINGQKDVTIRSGVYTLNEIPTAIWVFCAPTKDVYQSNYADSYTAGTAADARSTMMAGNWETNKLFGYMKHINISLANTTQILNTAEQIDLYRIAKANGCEDSYWSWGIDDAMMPKNWAQSFTATGGYNIARKMYYGAGSVLRLKPGVDIIVPDIPLIPGANANNMVLQVEATFNIPPHSEGNAKYALWLLFEYVGVAAISPGQCEITMNPLGSGEIMSVSPVMSATSAATEGSLDGAGFWDGAKKALRIVKQLADDGVLSRILKNIPGAGPAADWLKNHGLGEPCGKKRNRGAGVSGGAVMGRGLNDWM